MRPTSTTPTPRRHRIVSGTSHGSGRTGVGSWLRRAQRVLPAPGDLRGSMPAAPAAVVQERLADVGLLAPQHVTRRWDPTTVRAVEDFQRARGLTVDGIAGPGTVDLLLGA